MPWDDGTDNTAGGVVYSGAATAGTISYSFVLSNTATTTGFLGSGTNSGWYGFGGTPLWDPVQAAALRVDFDEIKYKWERKRAEVKARRLFKRVVGDIAYRRYRLRGFHEICGASHQRYRLRPGLRVQVMFEDERNPDVVDHELCAHLPFGVPMFDSMVVQHLMLTASRKTENQFKTIANRHNPHGPYPLPELTAVA